MASKGSGSFKRRGMDRDTARSLIASTSFEEAELNALYSQFSRQSGGTGEMNHSEFVESMKRIGLQDPVFIDHCFVAADTENKGKVDFQQVATTLSVLVHGEGNDLASYHFKLWATDPKGMTAEEFAQFYVHVRNLDPDLIGEEHEFEALQMELAKKAFEKLDVNKDGLLHLEEFQAAFQHADLLLSKDLFERLRDPLRTRGILSLFEPEERALLSLLGERAVVSVGSIIPYQAASVEGNTYDVFYLVVGGCVECNFENSDHVEVIEPDKDAWLHEETVFKKTRANITHRTARATTTVSLLRLATKDFLQAYNDGSEGALSIMESIKRKIQGSLVIDETPGRAPSVAQKDFSQWKKAQLDGEGKVMVLQNINQSLVNMQYAVRGLVPLTAERIQGEINAGASNKPFDEVLYCNIGNPHSVGQQPITYYREVLALVDCPSLLNKPDIAKVMSPDVVKRAQELSKAIKGGTGAYSHSQGVMQIRQHVAEFIEARDGHPCNPADLFLTNGASSGIQMMLNTLIAGPNDAVLVPIPQYPIYSALIKLLNGKQVGYQMDEENGWALDMGELTSRISNARQEGQKPRALVIINPGNPVGNCLSYDNLVDLVKLCKKEGLVLLADEVYQENVYTDRPFYSVKKVVRDLGTDYDGFEVVSFHSTSKGIIGECGRRGGYMELCGIDVQVQQQIYKLASSGLCSNLDGQVMVDLMVKGPVEGEESYQQFKQERDSIFEGLKKKSQMLHKFLNSIDGISCQPLQGAMYAFPKISLPAKAIAAAAAEKHSPDTFYALSLLEHTGICAIPGSGFGQKEGTFHLRMTFLPQSDKLEAALERFRTHHLMFIKKYT